MEGPQDLSDGITKLLVLRPEKGLKEGKRQPQMKETPREMKVMVPRMIVTQDWVFGLNCQDQKILKYCVMTQLNVWTNQSNETF